MDWKSTQATGCQNSDRVASTQSVRGPNSTESGATIDDALLISDTERPHFQKLTWVGHSGYTSPGLGWGAGILHGPMQIGIPLSGSSWEDGKLIRGTTCVLAGRLPPAQAADCRATAPLELDRAGCLLHDRGFSLELFPPLVVYPPRVFAKMSRSLA